jgi:hypothetical protein
MPDSNINLLVNLRTRFYDEMSFSEKTQRFYNGMAANTAFTKRIVFEENKGMMFAKIDTTPKYGSLRVEVTFKLLTHGTMPKNEEMILDYTKSYPEARPLFLITRSLARRFRLDDPSSGGFNTLSVFLLVVAFCQKLSTMNRLEASSSQDPQTISDQKPNSNSKFESLRSKIARKKALTEEPKPMAPVGEILMGFLSFYAFSFDFGSFLVCPFLPFDKRRDPFPKVNS